MISEDFQLQTTVEVVYLVWTYTGCFKLTRNLNFPRKYLL